LASPIGPNQHFIGLVNGVHVGAVIRVFCPGPSNRPGPPVGGQTFAVHRVSGGGGDTGANGRTVFAFLPVGSSVLVPFSSYDSPKPIPTSARLPCSGTGTVYFSTCPLPQPCSVGAKSDDVKVTFVNIAR
jgi:hypothetical protein